MPDPNQLSPGANGGRVDLQNAPGGEFNFDDLFPNPEVTPAAQPQAVQGTNPQQPQAPVQEQFFLRNTDGTIAYRTSEDAISGISHKDQLIARQRAFLAEQGFDPNELKPKATSQAQPAQPSPYKYLGQETKLFDDLSEAIANKDKAAYGRIQFQAMQEALDDRLAPYQSYIAESARTRAIRDVSREIPEFQNFYGSDAYKAVVKEIPLIRDMEQVGENNPEAAKRLSELYKLTYLVNQGLKQSNSAPVQQSAQPVQNPPINNRPTTQPSALTPPSPGVDTRNWAQSSGNGRQLNSDARKQLIKDYEARGVDQLYRVLE